MSSKSVDERHIEKWLFSDPETYVEKREAIKLYKERRMSSKRDHYYQNIGADRCGLCGGEYDGHQEYAAFWARVFA